MNKLTRKQTAKYGYLYYISKLFQFGFGVGESGEITCDMRAFPEPRFDWTLADQDHGECKISF